jgi:cation diffusion facilitator CzcD-associated flavoprotein CzcO
LRNRAWLQCLAAALHAGRTHSAKVDSFAAFQGLEVAVIGSGQSAL